MSDPLLGPAGEVASQMLAAIAPNSHMTREFANMDVTLADDGQQRGVILVNRRALPIHEYGLEVWAAAFGQPGAVWSQDWRTGGRVASMRWPVTPLLPDLTIINDECQVR